MIPMWLKAVNISTPVTISPNKKDPSKPFYKCRGLAAGADEFLELDVQDFQDIKPGVYDMQINFIDISSNGKRFVFLRVLQVAPSKQ